MHAQRLKLLEAMASQPTGPETLRLCAAAAQLLGAAGAGLTIAVDGSTVELGAATAVGAQLAELEFALGQGPATTAHQDGVLIEVPDLALDRMWPVLAPAAMALDLRAVVSLPLRRGSIRLGALTVCWADPGARDDEELGIALSAGRLALDLVLAMQTSQPDGQLDEILADGAAFTAPIHQASGMIAAQLGVPVGTALTLLRARAFADGSTLADLATEVLGRRLRFDTEPGPDAGPTARPDPGPDIGPDIGPPTGSGPGPP
ncbi:MAG: GAF and ANTAR domain-containing protein [Nitriliruptoraceae bacterium]|nr:GAF and ANTAR domain-containing protein [Nitriliruptoraceae bacterium]